MSDKISLSRAFDVRKFPDRAGRNVFVYFSFDTPLSHIRDFFCGTGRPVDNYVSVGQGSEFACVDYYVPVADRREFLKAARASSHVRGVSAHGERDPSTIYILHQKEGFRHPALAQSDMARVVFGSMKP